MKETKRPTATEVIEIFGGATNIARILKITQASVSGWKEKDRVPEGRLAQLAPFLERKTKGSKKPLSRKNLFPDDFMDRWPEIARQHKPNNSEAA